MENLIITRVVKNGTSIGVNIPKNICKALNIRQGDQVTFGVYSEDVICIRKITQRDLQNLKPKNIV